MEITHNNHQYKVTPMANQSFWRLTRVDSPREGFTVNRDWLVNHGYWQQVDQVQHRSQKMVKQYQDVKVIDLQCIYEIQGDETVCDADKQQATIQSLSYEWLIADDAKYGFGV